ncbi:MAG TPA: adenylosuccinate synthase [Bacteroidales bacterium]|jgi:adenylosuccinate synthase|nr:adenylosuccinate synthase [Bacteroidales bacterium]HOL97487.1 adenylosuccinate synthase [Bacteroidales bacterium]HOM35755.1 adenylosuccinate synthase [Bacteroidales bacterium]HPD23027.1 adenylosuccinate synthase [Bacteroidales bacterium]HRS98866.1 adenylosuccinate synthase [Bacteroidales bacterium]
MKVDVLLGLQWGDEGKGKIVDVITPKYDIIARFQGGPNAGHTLEFNGIKHVLHTIPSGIFHDNTVNLIGNGVVIDPIILKKEILEAQKIGANLKENLLISNKAQLILPSHRILDKVYEETKAEKKIGSTLKGIGPAYTDKTARIAVKTGDIFDSKCFIEKYNNAKSHHIKILNGYNYFESFDELEKQWFDAVEFLKQFKFVNSENYVNQAIKLKKSILAEGAQGSLLDIDFGSYPYVTSSNTTCSGVCTGLGISPKKVGKVYGIVKAYCTRVGSGPFPTELTDEIGQYLRDKGHEYGSTTGRPRRCGWLDLVALKYSIMLNGVDKLIVTKADVLSGLDTLKVAVAYKVNGEITTEMPYDLSSISEIIYDELPGWKKDISKCSKFEELPVELHNYLKYISVNTGVKIKYLSVGPDRSQTLKI